MILALLLAGGLLPFGVASAGAQQLCSASTAPTQRNPGYPGSTPYSSLTSRITSNCTGPGVDMAVQPDPYYNQAYAVAGAQPDAAGSATVDPSVYAQVYGYGYSPFGSPYGYGYSPYGYGYGYPNYNPYGYGSGYGYASPYAASGNPNCGPSGCGDLGAAPYTFTGSSYVPAWPNNPASWTGAGGYPYGNPYAYGYGYGSPYGYGYGYGYPYWPR